MLVTTVYDSRPDIENKARKVAREIGGTWIPRNRRSLSGVMKEGREDVVMVVSARDVKLHKADEKPLFFHPGMAYLRILRLQRGESDVLLECARVNKGDKVLDCTAGMASDAIVFSWAVGPQGSVTALESEIGLYYVVRDGLCQYESDSPELNEAMRRIRMVHADHLDYLSRLPDDSQDIVYFDPMFRIPLPETGWPDTFRRVSNAAPLNAAAVKEARRVARKAVVMKEHRRSGELERLGFNVMKRKDSNIAYGVMLL